MMTLSETSNLSLMRYYDVFKRLQEIFKDKKILRPINQYKMYLLLHIIGFLNNISI